jgi:hypothetical protein
VNELASLNDLPDNFFGLEGLYPHAVAAALELLQDRPVQLLKHEVYLPTLPEDLYQVDDVVVLQLLQDADLPQGRFPHIFVIVALLKLLDGHKHAALDMSCYRHYSISPIHILGVSVWSFKL